jgi:2-polyprenyl-6-methoxyphenol hydroxylase-like FAD-dependent oxidoreductase
MNPIVVAGGSIGGLATALFAARVGRDVVVVEADSQPVPSTAGDVWHGWRRRGVPQFRQVHGTQALGRSVLATRAPAVLDRLHEAGAHDVDLLAGRPEARRRHGADDLIQFRCRRPVLEWVLRSAVQAEPAITLRTGTEVTGLRVTGGRRPRVTGVGTTRGELAADLVVDATGRRSRVSEWCLRAGAAPPTMTTVDTGQAYYTRWFRRSSMLGPSDPLLRVDLPFATLVVAPADADWFSATFFAPVRDRALRTVLMDPDGFLGAVRAVPPAAPWLETAHAVGDVLFMGKLANHLRVPAGALSPAGLLPVADAAVCTNPTWGRGAALALAHAAALIDAVEECDDPSAATAALARWTAAHLEPWYHDTVLLDAETNARWAGRPPPSSPARPIRHADVAPLAPSDPGLLVAYMRYRNLLDAPAAFWTRPEVIAAVRAALDTGTGGADRTLPSREELLTRGASAQVQTRPARPRRTTKRWVVAEQRL